MNQLRLVAKYRLDAPLPRPAGPAPPWSRVQLGVAVLRIRHRRAAAQHGPRSTVWTLPSMPSSCFSVHQVVFR